MTKTEAAQRLGVSRQTIHEWITKGVLTTDADGNVAEEEILRVQERQPSRQADTARRHDSIALYEARIDELKASNAFLANRLLFMERQLSMEQEQRSALQHALISFTSGLQRPGLPTHEPLALPTHEVLDDPSLQGVGVSGAPTDDLPDLVTQLDVWEVTEEEPLAEHPLPEAVVDTPEPPTPTPTIEDKILAYLRVHPKMSVDAQHMARAIEGAKVHTMRTILGRLTKQGKIARLGKGQYGWRVS